MTILFENIVLKKVFLLFIRDKNYQTQNKQSLFLVVTEIEQLSKFVHKLQVPKHLGKTEILTFLSCVTIIRDVQCRIFFTPNETKS